MSSPSVVITGVSGQDGQLLARQLSGRGSEIVGVLPPGTPASQTEWVDEVPGLTLLPADLSDPATCREIIAEVRPGVVFHLAAISSVGRSWEEPVQTSQLNGLASVALMAECLELSARGEREVRFVNASSAEIFGATDQFPQNEQTPMVPNSPYGVSKAFAHMMATTFRARGLWVSNAILYNHESILRPDVFVTRKITKTAAAIARGTADELRLGNLEARRDWGWAPDYVDCLMRMATHDRPDDFVVATGESHSVRDFVAAAFSAAGVPEWEGYVEVEAGLIRPTDAVDLVGDATKARRELGWSTSKTFTEIVEAMVLEDLRLADARPR